MPVKAIYFSQQDVGKTIKSSKKRYTWKFNIDGTDYTIELFSSSISGKKKVTLNGATRHEESTYGQFQYSLVIKNNQCMVLETGDTFDLRINNQSFSHLYHVEKTKKEFQFEDGYKQSQDLVNRPQIQQKVVQSKPKNKQQDEQEIDEFEFDHGFDKFAPTENNQGKAQEKLNLKQSGQQGQYDSFAGFQNQYSKPISQPPTVSPALTKPSQQIQAQIVQKEFENFQNFGQQQSNVTKNDPFSNFGNFGFTESQQPKQENKPNPFEADLFEDQPPVLQQKPNDNLLEFMNEPVQQQQSISQQKQIPQDLLDIFDSSPQPQQQSFYIQPAQQPAVIPFNQQPPIQQLYQQQSPAIQPTQNQLQQQQSQQFPQQGIYQQQNQFPQSQLPPFQQQQQQSHLYQQQPYQMTQSLYQTQSNMLPNAYGQNSVVLQSQNLGYQKPIPINLTQQPVQKSTPFDDLF